MPRFKLEGPRPLTVLGINIYRVFCTVKALEANENTQQRTSPGFTRSLAFHLLLRFRELASHARKLSKETICSLLLL